MCIRDSYTLVEALELERLILLVLIGAYTLLHCQIYDEVYLRRNRFTELQR